MRTEALLAAAEGRLHEAGVQWPRLDAERLLRHVTGWDRARLIVAAAEEVPAETEARFRGLVEERARRRPLQHLTGTQAFWRHEFEVTPDVLVPRPETELLVEEGLRLLAGRQAPVVVDVGTGSGCIALSMAAERPDAVVHATDVSMAALDVARRNAVRLGVAARVHFHEGDLLAPVPGPVDLVAANPPYCLAEEWEALAPEVRDHEPRGALVPPEGWPALYERLARQSHAALRPGGHLLVEVGYGGAEQAAAVMRSAGLAVTGVRPDLQGIPRVVVARRP